MKTSRFKVKASVLLLIVSMLGPQCHSSEQPVERKAPKSSKERLKVLEYRGERFQRASMFIQFEGGCSRLKTCFIGTINDTLFGIGEIGRSKGCPVPYPILCWKDSLDHGIFYYNSEAARNCSGDSSAYIERFSGQVVGYVRLEDEQIYLVRHTILANVHSKLEQLNFDDRWPDMNRKPQKTYVVSSKSGIVGVFTNGIGLDWFPL